MLNLVFWQNLSRSQECAALALDESTDRFANTGKSIVRGRLTNDCTRDSVEGISCMLLSSKNKGAVAR